MKRASQNEQQICLKINSDNFDKDNATPALVSTSPCKKNDKSSYPTKTAPILDRKMTRTPVVEPIHPGYEGTI